MKKLEEEHKENLTPSKRNLKKGISRGDNEGLISILNTKDR